MAVVIFSQSTLIIPYMSKLVGSCLFGYVDQSITVYNMLFEDLYDVILPNSDWASGVIHPPELLGGSLRAR